MKKFLTLIFFLGATTLLSAQTTVTVQGNLVVSEGSPAADKTVHVSFVGDTIENEVYYEEHQVTSDQSGHFTQEFELPESVTAGYFYAYVINCNGEYVSSQAEYDVNQSDFYLSLKYCSNSTSTDTIWDIAGYIFGDSSAVPNQYRVYLYNEDGSDVDSIDTEGYYNFERPTPGAYFIQAMVVPGTDNPNNYIPTYYGQSTSWSNAAMVYTPSHNHFLYNIYLTQGEYAAGNGEAGGKLTQNQGPVSGAIVLLLDRDGNQVLTSTKTDSDGNYSFNLSNGEYKIRIEMFGYTSESNSVVISTENQQSMNEHFYIEGTTIKASSTSTGISSQNDPGDVSLYPNPVQDRINLNISSLESQAVEISIYNVTGKKVLAKSFDLNAGQNAITLPAGELTKGYYTITIANTSDIKTLNFVR